MIYVSMYLFAIVSANLLIAHFGKAATPWVGFLFIGFDLTARDRLHETWSKSGLVWKMGLLIATGSALTWIINRNAGQIALASVLAFTAAAIVDTVTYHLLRHKDYLIKVNVSNIASALIDSAVFFAIAFGSLSWLTFTQFLVKTLGGAVWVWFLSTPCQLGFHKWYDITITHRKCNVCGLEDNNYNPYAEV